MQFLTQIFHILFPLCSIAGSGYVYARYVNRNLRVLSELATDFFMPALLFYTLATYDFPRTDHYGLVALLSICIVLGSAVFAAPVVFIFKYRTKTFLPSMMFNNAGYIGLPIALIAFEEKGFQFMIIFFAIETCLHVTLIYYILGRRGYLFLLKQPFIIAILAALAYRQSGIQAHSSFLITVEMLANVALPLTVFTLGTRLYDPSGKIFKYLKEGIFVGILCPLSGVLALLSCFLFLELAGISLSSLAKQVLLFSAVLPPAISNFVFAERFKQEPEKTASFVMIANLMCLFNIPLLFYFIL